MAPWTFYNSSGEAMIEDGAMSIANNTNNRVVTATGADPASLNGEANLTFSTDLSITSGNIVIATAGKGIDFSAQTATSTGSMVAELLSHYEEGTFTPTIKDNSGDEASGYSRQVGHYTKIGNVVSYTIDVIVTGTTGMAGGDTVRLGGLPFTAGSGDKAFAVGYSNGLNITAGNYVSGWIGGGGTAGIFVVWDATTGASAMTITQMSASGQFKMFGVYNT